MGIGYLDTYTEGGTELGRWRRTGFVINLCVYVYIVLLGMYLS